MIMKIVAINGSYRSNGTIDQAISEISQKADREQHSFKLFNLRDQNIAFCSNCRECTQGEITRPNQCRTQDDMIAIVKEASQADLLIIASPMNFLSITAVMKKFMERLIPNFYWPWGKLIPLQRKKKANKKAILITSSSMPGFISKLLPGGPLRSLKLIAKTFNAKTAQTITIGNAAQRSPQLSSGIKNKINRATEHML